jgi:hypothetical protein
MGIACGGPGSISGQRMEGFHLQFPQCEAVLVKKELQFGLVEASTGATAHAGWQGSPVRCQRHILKTPAAAAATAAR